MAPTAPLDPLISLAIGIATSPGAYAVLLGSGVSREAGIPTGEEILRSTLTALYRTETESEGEPSEADLEDWLRDQGLHDAAYADVLERAFPAPQSRRDFLAGFFAGRAPGPTHVGLARLAAQGLIRVFLTTNFDPLLEAALRAEGLEPVIASDASSLKTVPSRETAKVFVLKLHGDATKLNIRNTPDELERLEPRMKRELEEICGRYGVVTLGYAGRDAAIAPSLSATSPRFGLYWMGRSADLNDDARAIIDAAGAYVIVRPSAADFVTELDRRVQLWTAHPTGATPSSVRADMVGRLSAQDPVGVRELLMHERRHFESHVVELLTAAADENPGSHVDQGIMARLETDLAALLERRIASVWALIEYDPSSIDDEICWIADLAARDLRVKSPFTAWRQSQRWLAWMLMHAVGVVAVVYRRFAVLNTLWKTQVIYYEPESLGAMRLAGAAQLGSALELGRFGQSLRLVGHRHLAAILSSSELVRTHYPEVLRGEHSDSLLGALGHLGDLSYLLAALGGRDGVEVLKLWQGDQVSAQLPYKLDHDRHLQERLAEDLLGVPADEVVVDVRNLVSRAQGPRP